MVKWFKVFAGLPVLAAVSAYASEPPDSQIWALFDGIREQIEFGGMGGSSWIQSLALLFGVVAGLGLGIVGLRFVIRMIREGLSR